MKTLLAAVIASSLLGYSLSNSALAQAATYSETVSNPNCVGNNTCTFLFPSVTGPGILTASRVTCRVITQQFLAPNVQGTIVYATLGKTSNIAKFEFLPSAAFIYGSTFTGTTGGFTINLIDSTTLYFIQAGGSPVINIVTSLPITVSSPAIDQPTCTVSGLVQ
jgi:hypothetical protein